MIHPLSILASAIALVCLVPSSATAQTASPAEVVDAVASDRSVEAPPSFRLVEHRTGGPASLAQAEATPSTFRISRPKRAYGLADARVRVLAFIRAAEMRHALPRGLLEALVEVESGYQPFVVSRAGAMGLAQLMPATAKALGVLNPFDARANVEGSARFLRAMIDRFGSIVLALAAYNAGPAAVLRASGIPGNAETPAYVAKVLAAWRSRGP